MTTRSVVHDTFTIERRYDAPPTRVFQAFADPAAKALWFAGPPEWEQQDGEFDFSVGGRETSGGGPAGGPVHTYAALYQDIVDNERIVYNYEMGLDGRRMSVSLACVQLRADGDGTRLTITEHGVFLDGLDEPRMRIEGTTQMLDALGGSLKQQVA
jgi:uncharacterized protein YndB with AHSA1/START domain